MKTGWYSYFLTLFLVSVLTGIVLWIVYPLIQAANYTILSPLPDFLSIPKNSQVSTLSLFLPSMQTVEANGIEKPDISAKAALVYDLTTGRTPFQKDADKKLPMASLTKVMTAIIALENQRPDDKYVVTKSALVGEDAMGLTEGEILSLEELLYGLILHSGNDAAEVLAYNYPRGRMSFVKAMNDKAAALGLSNTHFTNPSGLQGDGSQYTTVYDLMVITRYAILNFPLFTKVTATFQHTIPYSKQHKEFYLENETNLLTSYPGVKGVKTGYTPEAGLCLITYLDYGGHQIIGVLLNSQSRREEMKQLLDYSLKVEGVTPPSKS